MYDAVEVLVVVVFCDVDVVELGAAVVFGIVIDNVLVVVGSCDVDIAELGTVVVFAIVVDSRSKHALPFQEQRV